MPEPNKGEKKSKYIPRAIRYLMRNEGLTQERAAGKAYGMWEQHIRNRKKR